MGKRINPKTDQGKHLILRQMLIDARIAAGMNQSDVAKKLGKPQSYISKIELGTRRMDVVEFIEILEAINTDPELFFATLTDVFSSQK